MGYLEDFGVSVSALGKEEGGLGFVSIFDNRKEMVLVFGIIIIIILVKKEELVFFEEDF